MSDDGEFIDPLRDPRFPNRPQHQDFWSLSDTMLQLDGRMDMTASSEERADEFQNIVAEVIDLESVVYMAMQRASNITDDPQVRECIAAAWIEAFVAGVRYEKADHPHV